MYTLGMMQGRLSPRRPRVQSFPREDWALEFVRARALGVAAIEWLETDEKFADSPLWDDGWLARVRAIAQGNQIRIPSLCADYLILHPLTGTDDAAHLERVIDRASMLGCQVIVIPLVENSSVKDAASQERFLTLIRRPLEFAQTHGITLALETDLPIANAISLVERASPSTLGIYYDTGNAAALGYDIVDEVRIAAPYLRGVHIKDRPLGGPNVPLGEGAVDFDGFLSALAETDYAGALILETGVGDDWYASAARNLDFMRSHLAAAGATR